MKRLSKGGAGAPGPAPAPAPKAASASLVQEWSDLFQPVPERKAPKDSAVTWINGPRGPQPDFLTSSGMDESIYGWCDVMYDMMRKKAISELKKEEAKPKTAKKEKKPLTDDEVVLMRYS